MRPKETELKGPLRVSVRSLVRGFAPRHTRLRRAARLILDEEGYPRGPVSLVFLGDKAMTRINEEFTGRNGPTDVLSFDLRDARFGEEEAVLGEVLVSVDRAREQARRAGVGLSEEVARLVIHGLLHLAGYDHQTTTERRRMRSRERDWLARLSSGRGWVGTAPR